MTAPGLAAVLLASAMAVLVRVDGASLLASRLRRPARTRQLRIPARVAGVLGCLMFLSTRLGSRLLLVAIVGVVAAVLGGRLWRSARFRKEAVTRRRAVVELCDALAAELRAGMPPETALRHSVGGLPELDATVAAARLGGDVPSALRTAATMPGAEGLRAIAAGWQIAARTGGSLATVLERIGAGIRDDDAARQEVEASLGPPRLTSKLLAVLPIGGLALGSSMGADPIGVLLGTTPGLVCGTLGVTLALLGLLWVDRLANAVER